MPNFADVETIAQKVIEVASCKGNTSSPSTRLGHPGLRLDVLAIELRHQLQHTSEFDVGSKDIADERRFGGMRSQFSRFEVVPERYWPAAHPDSLLFRSGDFVSNPLSRNFPFELREREENV